MNKNEVIKILYDWNFWDKDLDIGIEKNFYVDRLVKQMNTQAQA